MDPIMVQPGVDPVDPTTSPEDPTTSPADPTAGSENGLPPEGGEGFQLPGAQQMATPEQKQQLMALIELIRQKLENFKSVHFATQGKTDAYRRQILLQVFEKLQLAGVDLNNPQSVSEFIEKLRQQNPVLAEQFEQAMDALLADSANVSAPAGSIPGDNENINSDVNQNIPQAV